MDGDYRSFVESLMGERIGGRYVIDRVLRSGGMGLVAAARYPELDQEVAIKFMRPDFASNTTLAARFLREARLAAKVKSPHFVRIFDFGRLDSGLPYIVMEMLKGRDLRDELEARGPLPVEEAVDFVVQAAVGLAELHAFGIVHRDLKPSNLFLSEAAGTRSIKVLDFGISKEVKATFDLTSTGAVVGTAHYMSPEQIKESKTADSRSDVWALGVILYELLTQSLPFGSDHESPGEIYGLILHTDPVPPRSRRADLPEPLEAVLLKCLARDADARYANVAELADALGPFAATESIHRIQAVHDALASAEQQAAGDAAANVGSADTLLAETSGSTAKASPGAKRPPDATAAAQPHRPDTGMTATAPSRRMLEKLEQRRVNQRAVVVGGGALVLLGAGAIYLSNARSVSVPPPEPSHIAVATSLPSATIPVAVSPIVAPPSASPSAAVRVTSTVSSSAAPPRKAAIAEVPKHQAPLPAATASGVQAAPTATGVSIETLERR